MTQSLHILWAQVENPRLPSFLSSHFPAISSMFSTQPNKPLKM